MKFHALLIFAAACSSVDLEPTAEVSAADAATDTSSIGFADGTPGPGADIDLGPGDALPLDDATAGGDVWAAEDALADAAMADTAALDATDVPLDDVIDPDGTEPTDAVAPPLDIVGSSRCAKDGQGTLYCQHETLTLDVPVGLFTEARDVLYEVPMGAVPAGGFPVVILFHGTYIMPEYFWEASDTGILGAWYQALVVKELLDAGFAVLTPRAEFALSYWNTNVAPWNMMWTTSPDHQLMLTLIDAIANGDFGPLNGDRLYASGVSSGGYMASRVALTYAGVKAIAVHSASYMTCAASICVVPTLESSHPPALFLHGELDPVVPMMTMELYRDALVDAGVQTKTVTDPAVGHEWIPASPSAMVAWFLAHP
jgi:predicted esterase